MCSGVMSSGMVVNSIYTATEQVVQLGTSDASVDGHRPAPLTPRMAMRAKKE